MSTRSCRDFAPCAGSRGYEHERPRGGRRGRRRRRGGLATAHVVVRERAGPARFVDAHTIETASGLRIRGERFVVCTGGASRKLSVPGVDLTVTHEGAWSLSSVPPSMLVVGGGATGVQVASIFNAFGTHVELFQAGDRLVPTEDEDVSIAVAEAFRADGIVVREAFGTIDSFERAAEGVRMTFSKHGVRDSATAAFAVIAVGWTANTAGLDLAMCGVETTPRGFVRVDEHLRTSARHVFAAGDVTGQMMLVPQALQQGFVAGTNAVRGPTTEKVDVAEVSPIGSFTDPEYAQAGLTEARARETRGPDRIVVAVVHFDETTRTIIDGRTSGFCKVVVDRQMRTILGCHVVGERAVDIVQSAAIAVATGMQVQDLARVPLSFPTYTGVLGRAAAVAARQLQLRASASRSAEWYGAER